MCIISHMDSRFKLSKYETYIKDDKYLNINILVFHCSQKYPPTFSVHGVPINNWDFFRLTDLSGVFSFHLEIFFGHHKLNLVMSQIY